MRSKKHVLVEIPTNQIANFRSYLDDAKIPVQRLMLSPSIERAASIGVYLTDYRVWYYIIAANDEAFATLSRLGRAFQGSSREMTAKDAEAFGISIKRTSDY